MLNEKKLKMPELHYNNHYAKYLIIWLISFRNDKKIISTFQTIIYESIENTYTIDPLKI